MSAAAYNLLGTVAAIVSGFSGAMAIMLFFRFNIMKLIGDLSGRTAKREIESIREGTTERKASRPFLGIKKRNTEEQAGAVWTQDLQGTNIPDPDRGTEMLTTVSVAVSGETELLSEDELKKYTMINTPCAGRFEIIKEVILTESREVI